MPPVAPPRKQLKRLKLPYSSQAIHHDAQSLRLGSAFSLDDSAGMVRLRFRDTSLLAASAWCAS
jgi:hypothetical protein